MVTDGVKKGSWSSGDALLLHGGNGYRSVSTLWTFIWLQEINKQTKPVSRSNRRATDAHPRHTYTHCHLVRISEGKINSFEGTETSGKQDKGRKLRNGAINKSQIKGTERRERGRQVCLRVSPNFTA